MTSRTTQPAETPSAIGLNAFRDMLTIRRFEERCLDLATEGLIAGSIHLCLGQEAIPVGAMAALTNRDRVLSTYRGHGWALACGVPIDALLGEICQREGGVNGGRAGSPHLSAPEFGFLGENSIVGAGVPIATGVAIASFAKDEDRVVVVSIGDGAMNQGATHEGLLFAAARNLPVIFICENNGWAEMTSSSAMVRTEDLADRAAGYGMPGRVVDGDDPSAVSAAVTQAAEEARAGEGPILLECKTMRLSGHYNRDIQHYRSKEDIEAAHLADPLGRLRMALLEAGECTSGELAEVDAEVQAVVDTATETVRSMPLPDPATARDHLYSSAPAGPTVRVSEEGEELTYVKAVTSALRTELEARPDVLVYGEDVGVAGGIFGVTRGLQESFGAGRVFDTPIAESAILGSAVGASIEGMRPVVEIMWGDFLLVALDQLINQAANVRYVSRSKLTAPLVVRTQHGVTPGSCAQHSQSLEALLAHIPGLKVGLSATPQDAYSMLRSAIADEDPCVVIESRSLYQQKGNVDLSGPVAPVGGARIHRDGSDVVLITWGQILHTVLEAADHLARDGVGAYVLDLRWLTPLDDDAIERAVRASAGRVLIVHEANVTGGFGAEVAARIQERHFDYLDAPVARLGVSDVRIPSSPVLQGELVPSVNAIVDRAKRLSQAEG